MNSLVFVIVLCFWLLCSSEGIQGTQRTTKSWLYEPAQIVENFLYLGSKISAENRNILDENEISAIVNCAIEIPNVFTNVKEADGIKITYLSLEMDDDPSFDPDPSLQTAIAFLNDNLKLGKRVLIHCQAGISRSATIVIGYLMVEQKMPLKEAYQLVKTQRPQIQPNAGFFKFLQQLELKLFGTQSMIWEEYLCSTLEDMGISSEKAAEVVKKYGHHRLNVLFDYAFQD